MLNPYCEAKQKCGVKKKTLFNITGALCFMEGNWAGIFFFFDQSGPNKLKVELGAWPGCTMSFLEQSAYYWQNPGGLTTSNVHPLSGGGGLPMLPFCPWVPRALNIRKRFGV